MSWNVITTLQGCLSSFTSGKETSQNGITHVPHRVNSILCWAEAVLRTCSQHSFEQMAESEQQSLTPKLHLFYSSPYVEWFKPCSPHSGEGAAGNLFMSTKTRIYSWSSKPLQSEMPSNFCSRNIANKMMLKEARNMINGILVNQRGQICLALHSHFRRFPGRQFILRL